MIYIGIDPGAKGGIAYIEDVAGIRLSCNAVPYSPEVLKSLAKKWGTDDLARCCLENVHSMPKQGVKSTFAFGESFGYIKGVLESFEIPYQEVAPNKWKKEFSLIGKDKAASIYCAKKLFPGVSLIPDGCRVEKDGLAEALLMAEYARRHF